jgi:hypothetical protein
MSENNDTPPSLNDFKKWLTTSKPKLEGVTVEPKLSLKRIAKNISVEEGQLKAVAKDFCRYGGRIIEVGEFDYLLEVEAGTFRIPKFFCRLPFDH